MNQFWALNMLLASENDARNHFCDIFANHVATENLVGIFIKNKLNHTVAAAGSGGFSGSGKRELTNAELVAGFQGLLLREADRSNFRSGDRSLFAVGAFHS